MTQATPDRPLVTFALLAYNQEEYIREAVEGAFSQTYEPLEIILSDDCSTDRTFAIIEELAKAYDGPHSVQIVRNEANLGLIDHLETLRRRASGKYMVCAAGDDISLPQRTDVSVRRLMETGVWLAHSTAIFINADGSSAPHDARELLLLWHTTDVEKCALDPALYFGATQALDMKIWDRFGPITHKSAYEDSVLGFRAVLSGGVTSIDEKIVKYRLGVGICSEARRAQGTPGHRAAELRSLNAQRDIYLQRLADFDKVAHKNKGAKRAIEHRLHEFELRLARRRGWNDCVAKVVSRPILSCKMISAYLRAKFGVAGRDITAMDRRTNT